MNEQADAELLLAIQTNTDQTIASMRELIRRSDEADITYTLIRWHDMHNAAEGHDKLLYGAAILGLLVGWQSLLEEVEE